ncbi:MAG: hypothetical protein ACUVUS_05095 [Thermoproteota archaeon]
MSVLLLTTLLFVLGKALLTGTRDPQDFASDTSADGTVVVSAYGNYHMYEYYDSTGNNISSNNLYAEYYFAGYLYLYTIGRYWPVYAIDSSFYLAGSRTYSFPYAGIEIVYSWGKSLSAWWPDLTEAECSVGPPGTV